MMTLSEKVAYLKGLSEGIGLADEGRDKLLKSIIDTLCDAALSIEDLEDEMAELGARVDEIDEDLADVESDLYEDEDEDDCDCDCDCDCCDGNCAECDEDCFDADDYDDFEEYDEDDEETVEVVCPACEKTICLPIDSIGEDGIVCPECSAQLKFDFTDEEEEEAESADEE